MARRPMVTSCAGTVVDILATVVACPSVDTHAVIAAVGIMACPAILTRVGHQLTLINILSAVLACKKTPAQWVGHIVSVESTKQFL